MCSQPESFLTRVDASREPLGVIRRNPFYERWIVSESDFNFLSKFFALFDQYSAILR
jgi:hypothetical protein